MLQFPKSPVSLHAKLHDISAEEWYSFLCGDRYDPALMEFISDMPSEQIQMRFTGASGKATLIQAFDFYKLVLSYLDQFNLDLKNLNILDFGCGWGRIIRFFVKDIDNARLFGVDPLPEIIEICKATVKRANFYVIQPRPPISDFASDIFDIVYAYSVFSHLNEKYTHLWFHEFNRILKKRGLLIVTTRSRSFIEHTALLRSSCANPDYARSSFHAFIDTQKALADYDAGKLCHHPTGGGDILSKDFFGETCIPVHFFTHNFSDIFNVEIFIDNLAYEPNQACVILKKI